MTISMYQASVPVLMAQLRALSAILDKGAAFAAERGMAESELLEAKLAPDMFALPRQIQIATDMAKGGVMRLAGREIPAFPDDETSIAALKERIARTIALIGAVQSAEIDGSETRTITLKVGPQDMTFVGQPYLLSFVLPNVYFHVTTTYLILRHLGAPLGKRDFLGM